MREPHARGRTRGAPIWPSTGENGTRERDGDLGRKIAFGLFGAAGGGAEDGLAVLADFDSEIRKL